MMTEEEAVKAHEILELFQDLIQDLIIATGVTLLKELTPDQQEYVITKTQVEFRFWRIEDKLK